MLATPFVLASLLAGAGTGPQEPARADFSGYWAIDEKLSDDPFGRWLKKHENTAPGSGRSEAAEAPGRRRSRAVETGFDVPTQLLEDDSHMAVVDDGRTVRITRAGRQSRLVTDGEERELDLGDGPAEVKVSRKGGRGEKLVFSSAWASGQKIRETWELQETPRRLVITTELSGRTSLHYRRFYDPAPPPPTPTPTPLCGVTDSPCTSNEDCCSGQCVFQNACQ